MSFRTEFSGDVPVRLLLGGLIVGAVVGAIAPVSDYERRRAVPARSDLIQRVRSAFDDLLGHARIVMQQAFFAAGDSANKHGQELAADVRREFAVAPNKSSGQQSNVPDL